MLRSAPKSTRERPRRSIVSVLSAVLCSALMACSLVVGSKELDRGCPQGTKECDGTCVDTTDPANGCAELTCVPCGLANATSICGFDGHCTIAACASGWSDCNVDQSDGCEQDINYDADNCGACGQSCSGLLHVSDYVCGLKVCKVGTCEAGWGDCDGDRSNGCEVDLNTSPEHCGKCDIVCTGSECAEGTCQGS